MTKEPKKGAGSLTLEGVMKEYLDICDLLVEELDAQIGVHKYFVDEFQKFIRVGQDESAKRCLFLSIAMEMCVVSVHTSIMASLDSLRGLIEMEGGEQKYVKPFNRKFELVEKKIGKFVKNLKRSVELRGTREELLEEIIPEIEKVEEIISIGPKVAVSDVPDQVIKEQRKELDKKFPGWDANSLR